MPIASALLASLLFAVSYFDAHNHISGILPYAAYANLPAFVAGFDDARSVNVADRLALYRYLDDVWYPTRGAPLGNRLFSPADGQRFGLGARAALVVYRGQIAGSVAALDGTLERVLTATPWSEFDSAYAFRGGPAGDYLRGRFYGGNDDRLSTDICRATVIELALTHVDQSEQSLPFVGGWRFSNGESGPLTTIACVMHAGIDATIQRALAAIKRPAPSIKIVLMTHTAQLATLPGGREYSEWSKTGTCRPAPLPATLVTTPKMIYDALMGWDAGRLVVPANEAMRYFDDVVGIDTAAPETNCFTSTGMAYYRALIDAVYRASKARRLAGWHGKLLVHTHVGEGGVIDYAPNPPAQPWTYANLFATLPPTRTNTAQAEFEHLDALGCDSRLFGNASRPSAICRLPARSRDMGYPGAGPGDARCGGRSRRKPRKQRRNRRLSDCANAAGRRNTSQPNRPARRQFHDEL